MDTCYGMQILNIADGGKLIHVLISPPGKEGVLVSVYGFQFFRVFQSVV